MIVVQGHETTSAAILIGIAASKMSSCDPIFSRTLCLHLPALLPPLHCDLEISSVVQSAALSAMGLLYCKSAHRLMTEFLLAELIRKPSADRCDNREALALGAGWALGMVLLKKGSHMPHASQSATDLSTDLKDGLKGLSDLHIEDRLQLLIDGGRRSQSLGNSPFAVSPKQRSLFSMSNPIYFFTFSFSISLSLSFNCLKSSSDIHTDTNSKSSRVLEGDFVNIDVTAVGATVALTLMYLATNNSDIAQRLSLPQTATQLDSIRPDLLLYRALGHCLIMWNNVQPSEDWMASRIPPVSLNTPALPYPVLSYFLCKNRNQNAFFF